MTIPLSFRFKGDRHYVQGADICDEIDKHLRQAIGAGLVGITFRGFTSSQCDLSLTDGNAGKIIATGHHQTAEGKVGPFWLTESSRAVIERRPFHEDLITGMARIQDETITLKPATQFTLAEDLVALTKALNYALTPDVDGKWVFAQLKLEKPLPFKYGVRAVTRLNAIANRYSNHRVSIDGEAVGEIRFIVGKP